MKTLTVSTLLFLTCCSPLLAANASFCEPWQSAYVGDDMNGSHVIAFWPFAEDQAKTDVSGNGHTLEFKGVEPNPQGRFGSCLESFSTGEANRVPHAALARNHPKLSPQGAFTIEMWVQAKPELAYSGPVYLLDKKYKSNNDYQLSLTKSGRYGDRRMQVDLGFGSESAAYTSRNFLLEPDKWHHIAFAYDGMGTVTFFFDGLPWGQDTQGPRESVSPGQYDLHIGDRAGSSYASFPGFIDEVRITKGARTFSAVRFEPRYERTSYLRMEENIVLEFDVTNLLRKEMTGAVVRLSVDGMNEKTYELPPIGTGDTHTLKYALDTRMKPGPYHVNINFVLPGPEPLESHEYYPLSIAARQRPHRFPVLMWGVGTPERFDTHLSQLEEMGFTHCIGIPTDHGRIWKADKPTSPSSPNADKAIKRMLDKALVHGINIAASLYPGRYAKTMMKEWLRIDRQGKPYHYENPKRAGICALFPKLLKFCRDTGVSIAQAYKDYPAFEAALVDTEIRNTADPCFHPHDFDAFRKHAGIDIPDEVESGMGVEYQNLSDFPADRVIPDDHPIYRFYKWYWKEGDGWNAAISATVDGLKSIIDRKDFWTWTDPAVRVASVYGSGGNVDVIEQWTYVYPDPIRIGLATDELLTMARGADHDQKVMKLTQTIWYRNSVAPRATSETTESAKRPSYVAPWEQQNPYAYYITIPPTCLREAIWTEIARPIHAIGFHGWQSLVFTEPGCYYRFTNSQTQHEMARIIKNVVEPLGPTLLQVPGIKSDIAFLESLASEMFAGRGTYGWGLGWDAEAYHVLMYAHLQPDIVYDETVIEKGLDDYRVLVMANCDVLTEKVAEKVKAFQKKGGIIVGDERLCPAIKANILMEPFSRYNEAHEERLRNANEDKDQLLARAAQLRKDLDPLYNRHVDTSNPEVIPYLRRWNNADYVFLVNDQREYGTYLGHHKLVMENGLPSEAVVSINRKNGFVYDLVKHCPVASKQKNEKLNVDVSLGPCEGSLLMISPQAIAAIELEAPYHAQQGSKLACHIKIVDANRKCVDAVVPVEVEIRDPEGRTMEFSGSYAAVAGAVELTLDMAPNDTCGIWQISARDLASGQKTTHYLRLGASSF